MTINELINNFTEHLKKYGLNGDSKQQELYKREIISKYHDKLDADSSDFAKNISEMNFLNLWYSGNQRTAVQNFLKYEPEEYRSLHRLLYDETQPLQKRVTAFIDGNDSLWNTKIKQYFPDKETSSCCDERLISCFLADLKELCFPISASIMPYMKLSKRLANSSCSSLYTNGANSIHSSPLASSLRQAKASA